MRILPSPGRHRWPARCRNMKNKEQIPQESLVRIFMNGDFLSALLCTPRDVRELVVGWLFNEGYVQSIEDIGSLAACENMRDIHVQVPNPRPVEQDRDQMIRTSACMGGEISISQFSRDAQRLNEGPVVSLAHLKSLMKKTLTLASSYKETGGIHCAGIASATEQRILAVFEDVGRHNPFDKVIGRMLLTKLTPEEKVLLTSGRISSEMALKAAHSRIPVVATITTGTDLAVRIAEDAGITLVVRALSASPLVLCGEQRIAHAPPQGGLRNSTQA